MWPFKPTPMYKPKSLADLIRVVGDEGLASFPFPLPPEGPSMVCVNPLGVRRLREEEKRRLQREYVRILG